MRGAILKLGIIEMLIGIAVLFSIAQIANMYGLRQQLENSFVVTSFWGSFLFLIAMAATVIAIPAILMGMAFPLALKISLNGRMEIGTGVGTIYAANTIGSLFGALLAGFVSISLLGVMKSIVIAGAVFLILAAILFVIARGFKSIALNVAAFVPVACGFILIAGPAPDFSEALARGLNADETLLYFKETVTGDVQVTESRSEGRILRIDGREVASDGPTDLPGLLYPSHLVSLLKKQPKSALFVALGAGGSAGSILKYNDLERLDIVEICGGVVEPARRYFSTMNCGALDDPRLRLIIQDGKNFVHLTDNTYDIIFSGPIHPQSNQGSAALYTRDFFEDCRKRLNKGGIMCIWIPMHMPPDDYKTIVKTFLQVYPHCSLWLTTNSPNTITHTHLIGSIDPIGIDYDLVNEKLQRPAVRADLGRLGHVHLSNSFDFIGEYAMGDEKLRQFTASVAHINTDNLPTAEFFMKIGRKIYLKNRECPALLLSDILRYKESDIPGAIAISCRDSAGLGERLAEYCKGDSLRIRGHMASIMCNVLTENPRASKEDITAAFGYYSAACRDYSLAQHYLPDDRFLKEFFVEASRMAPHNQ